MSDLKEERKMMKNWSLCDKIALGVLIIGIITLVILGMNGLLVEVNA